MHIIPAIENNADGFSSSALHLFKQHPHFPQRALPGLPKHSSSWELKGFLPATLEAEGNPESKQPLLPRGQTRCQKSTAEKKS